MNIAGGILGLVFGAVIGALVGRYKIYHSLNKTNLIGMDTFGNHELKQKTSLGSAIFTGFVGTIFAVIGSLLTIYASSIMNAANNPDPNSNVTVRVYTSEGGLMVFGALMAAMGLVVIFGSVQSYRETKARELEEYEE